MLANLELSGGLIYSGTLLLELVRKGVLRETAYQWLQRNAMRSWDQKEDFLELVLADPDITSCLSQEEIRRTFDYREKVKHVDTVFKRVFQK